MPNRIVVIFLLFSCLTACFSEPHRSKSSDHRTGLKPLYEATGFSIQQLPGYQIVTVVDPWQKSEGRQFEYYLVKKGQKIPSEIKDKHILSTPLQRVICLSTTHIGFLEALGEISSITGLSGSSYLTNAAVKKGLAENRIREVGYEQGLNYEAMVQLKPEVVFAFGVGAEVNAQINKLRDLGIPVVLVGEYLERTPLAKAEWIRFFGSFYEKEALADTVFEKIKNNYLSVKSRVENVKYKPSVLTGLPFKDTWWIAGGQSNLAVLIEDAGGKFLWKENPSKEAFPVSLEEVFLRAVKADCWINTGSAASIPELLAFDERFSDLPAVKQSQVFNNNLRSTPGGGNDYWESGVVHPDLALLDLVTIFHPEVAVNRDFYYYKKLR